MKQIKIVPAMLMLIFLTAPGSMLSITSDEYEKIDGTAACQACEDNAAAMRADCEAVYGEGDADCRHQSEVYRISCQNEWCH